MSGAGERGVRPMSRSSGAGRLARASSAAVMLAFATAPFQCAREPDPNRRMEDDPAEVVYKLAERFGAEGKRDAQVSSLKFLVERYPSSRFAKMAATDLEGMGQSPLAPRPAPTPAPTPTLAPTSAGP